MARSKAKFSVDLDAIRALAAVTVFVMHAKGLFIGSVLKHGAAAGRNPSEFTSPAHEAVIVFFVLSGYFVGGGVLRNWKNRIWTWRTYAIQRLTRLWIVLLPALLVTLALDLTGLHFFGLDSPYGRPHWESFISTGILSSLNAWTFCGCLFFLQKILVEPLGSNGALWTLSYEFWFYVAFPLALSALSSRFSLPTRMLNAALLIGAGFFVGHRISAYFLIWLMGAALQLAPKKLSSEQARRLTQVGVALLFVVSMVLWAAKWNLFASDLIEGCVCAMLCYVILHKTDPANEGSLYVKAAKGVSNMSYTLYLTHLPILVFFCALFASRGFVRAHDLRAWMVVSAVLTLTFGICYLLYLCFERRSDRVRSIILAAHPYDMIRDAFGTEPEPGVHSR
ncbi:acyltransferase family protein [Occallatibacter riparius]|uniref:Acyltransferase n=1 Tax=Occallatibacter riparius TaxID=1002689 RepID=A0A9J7BNY5_9BACT|nr:acyltransferase [Occallatibacter riparius]UWZ84596.1 acyltransferase [Occallatibacter riparius]